MQMQLQTDTRPTGFFHTHMVNPGSLELSPRKERMLIARIVEAFYLGSGETPRKQVPNSNWKLGTRR